MEFVSGKHLVNYLLKIFKNNDFSLPNEKIIDIKKLENVFNFIENLSISVIKNIISFDGYHPWIFLAQGNKYEKLSEIAKISNEYIAKYKNNPSDISFDTVFNSFELEIKYRNSYLKKRPNKNDIYYPHYLKILDGKILIKQWNIGYYTKPKILKEDNIGCYFIYDNDGELVYIGKSNSNLYERSCTSAQDRTNGDFSKIELYSMPTHANTNIYELYFIAKYNPKFNSDSRCADYPTFELPKITPKYTIEKIGVESFEVEQISTVPNYISSLKYWENPEKYFLYFEEDYNRESLYGFFLKIKTELLT